MKTLRKSTQTKLDRLQNTYGELLSDILLANHYTEKRLERSGMRNYTKVDKVRKLAINGFMNFLPEE